MFVCNPELSLPFVAECCYVWEYSFPIEQTTDRKQFSKQPNYDKSKTCKISWKISSDENLFMTYSKL